MRVCRAENVRVKSARMPIAKIPNNITEHTFANKDYYLQEHSLCWWGLQPYPGVAVSPPLETQCSFAINSKHGPLDTAQKEQIECHMTLKNNHSFINKSR